MSIHFKAGERAAKSGEFRAAPSNLKILTQPHRDWYAGFDSFTRAGGNPKLNESFSLRIASAVHEVSIEEK